jgi:hypothetical protein
MGRVWVCRMSWKHPDRDRSDWITRWESENHDGLCEAHWQERLDRLAALREKRAARLRRAAEEEEAP